MTFSFIERIGGRITKAHLALALTLLLLLTLALSLEPARASAHASRQAQPARMHRVWPASGARHTWAFAPAYRRSVSAFASAQPRFDDRTASTSAGQSVVAEAMRFVGAGNVTGMSGAWCADYASMILRRAGRLPLANRTVSAALAYGPRVRQPQPGDLVVINTRAGYAQHVGFFAGWDHGEMLMVSGNWRHRVAVAPISRGAVAAFIGV